LAGGPTTSRSARYGPIPPVAVKGFQALLRCLLSELAWIDAELLLQRCVLFVIDLRWQFIESFLRLRAFTLLLQFIDNEPFVYLHRFPSSRGGS
jgi:hypothetical protein